MIKVIFYKKEMIVMKAFNYSKLLFYFFALTWLCLSALKIIDVSTSYLYLGNLSMYLALENLFKLYAHYYTDYKNARLLALEQKLNAPNALRWYGLSSIGLYLVIGLFLIYEGTKGMM